MRGSSITEFQKPPVFIVGSPRSGTTLLQNLLSRHPSIAIANETRFFADIYKRRSAFGSLENLRNRERLADQYLSTARVKRLEVDLTGLKPRLLAQATSYPRFLAAVMRYCADFHGKQRCGEKTPHHCFFTETLCDWFPGAYIIHLVRDPRDVVTSLQRMPWAPKSIVNNAMLWLLFNRAAERSRHRPEYLLVHYERLVTSPEKELARICAHIGEEWPSSLDVSKDSPAPYYWPKSTQGSVIRDRMQKWREQLTTQEVSVVERIVGARLEGYGYSPAGAPASVMVIIKSLAAAGFDFARRGALQFPHAWYYLTQPTNLVLHEHWKYRHAWESMFPGLAPPAANSSDPCRR